MRRAIPASAVSALLLLILAPAPLRADSNLQITGAAKPNEVRAAAARGPEPLFDGIGRVHHSFTTKSPLAETYFDQGLAFTYAFNHDEAGRSFEQAAQIDPAMPMAYWGIALVLGPNYNLPGDKARGKRAYQGLVRAASLAAGAKPVERDLIAALKHRYGPDGEATPRRDAEYADAMRALAHRYPDDPDVQTLFAESLMDLHPWQLWRADGSPGPQTSEIVSTLEAVLKRYPDHVGANHYYIHAVEASPNPERAIPSADRLPALAPKAAHLVHMPSHIYIHTGRYHDSVVANEHAVEADREYLEKTKANAFYLVMYDAHNIHFLCYSAMMEGNRKEATGAAHELSSMVTAKFVRGRPDGEYMMPTRYFVEARFGAWDQILAEPAPPADFAYTSAIWHYARGLAFSAKGSPEQAEAELKALNQTTAAMPAGTVLGTTNHGKDVLELACAILSGEIAASRRDRDTAVRILTEAVHLQDALLYDEPPIWYFPVREALGAELMAAGRSAEAEQVYRKDLALNPDNPRSLYGLAQSLSGHGKAAESAEVDARFRLAWRFSDGEPPRIEIAAPGK